MSSNDNLPFHGSSNVLAPLLFIFISQDNGAEVWGDGSEVFWQFIFDWVAVGNRARYRSQSALSGHGHKAYTHYITALVTISVILSHAI